ncbi:MAG: AraC family transcriptional regulator [Herbinix sp.]|jgi:AraC-like DNA-binding protein|nr:AraC family transcriptional regulator [Herbinix sp.]
MDGYLERASLTWSDNSLRLIETASQTAKNNYLYIQEAGYFETKYPYFTERKNLNSFLLIYTISGKGHLKYDEKDYTLTSGTVFLIDCIKYHYYESSIDDPWVILWVHFNGSYAMGYYEELMKNGFSILEPEDTFPLESSLRRILSLHEKKDVNRELITSSLIVNILTEMILMNTPKELYSHYTPNYIKEIKEMLNNRYKDRITLDDLERELNISKYHLAKEFKKHTGTTVNEYLIDQRLSHAKELLKYSDLSVSEITFSCGMNNVSHFINLFKDREGRTPLNFRKEWKF